MSYDPSRKSFLAKIIGLTTAAGLAPRLVAQTVATRGAEAAAPAGKPTIVVRAEARAVPRREGTV